MRIPVTGLGAIAANGTDPDQIFKSLCTGQGGPEHLRGFDRRRFTAQRLFEIDDRGPDGDRPLRATAFLLEAISQALADAGLGDDLGDVPMLVGTGLRELRSVELWHRDGAEFRLEELHFGTALRERFNAFDTHTFSNACSASLYALALGADLIDCGDADTVVVAGVDTVTESMFGLADRVQPHPPESVRPFDSGRQGTILGDGAAAVVLQRPDTVRDPAAVHGWIRGVSANCDAYHPTAPSLEGVTAAIAQAHARSGLGPDDVDLVLLHGTGTALNDPVEATALRQAHGASANRPLMTAIKALTGHTSGSAGLMSCMVALKALREGTVPPVAGLTDPIPETAGFRLVRPEAARETLDVAQVHGFGFGGINAVAILQGPR
ncbi:beta-ketoacyl synthase N-terminal-like domain-containing protein [Micromonospora sp. NPDC005220]|uniref:beta-ketoacyl synthase N-terminal-like domain-containing protein n=1 Tax=Micromonospora sp. NPDC005220 TaxID=3155589 RepID=UPI0033B48DB5